MDKRNEKILEFMAKQRYDVILVVGSDNITYLSDIVLPFPLSYPDRQAALVITSDGDSCVFCPCDWSQAVSEQGWDNELRTYDENENASPRPLVEDIVLWFSERNLKNVQVGIDGEKMSFSFLSLLKKLAPSLNFEYCDNILEEIRVIKTGSEVDRLETAAIHSDQAIVTALMHLEGTVDTPGYTIAEFSERMRVHVFEFGGTGVGHVATLQGEDARQFYHPQRGMIKQGKLVKMDLMNHYLGYWSSAGRMVVIGEPTYEQISAYEDNMRLKGFAESLLLPDVQCKEIFESIKKTAKEMEILFWEEAGIGHGVGVSPVEAPYLNMYDQRTLKPGMVIVLDIYTYGPDRDLLHSKDMYEITEDGSRLLSWFKKWDDLYMVTGIRSTH